MSALKKIYRLLRDAVKQFSADDATTLAASIGFYTLFSLAPLLLIMVALGGMAGQNSQTRMVEQARTMIGDGVADALANIMENASQERSSGTISMIIGFGTMAFAATGVFAQFQTAMNRIWNVEPQPGRGFIKNFLRKRLLSLGMILLIALLLVASVIAQSIVPMLAWGHPAIMRLLALVVSMALFVLMFAMVFKYLPDAEIQWRDVWVGAAITAILFALGNLALGEYLAGSAAASSYGAAGSLVILLLWVYYSALIVFFGAELTQVYAHNYGSRIVPEAHAGHRDEEGGASS